MTIEALYMWALENKCEDYEIERDLYCDFKYVYEEDLEIHPEIKAVTI